MELVITSCSWKVNAYSVTSVLHPVFFSSLTGVRQNAVFVYLPGAVPLLM